VRDNTNIVKIFFDTVKEWNNVRFPKIFESVDALRRKSFTCRGMYWRRLIEFAIKNRLPSAGGNSEQADAGFLISYRSYLPDLFLPLIAMAGLILSAHEAVQSEPFVHNHRGLFRGHQPTI